MTRAQPVIGERKLTIQFNRPREVSNRGIAVFLCDRAKDKSRKAIATAQIFFVSFGINGRRLGQTLLFIGAQFEPQTIDDAFRDLVLHGDDVVRGSIDSIAPDDFAALHVEQLCVNTKMSGDSQKSGGQNGIDV